jgi:protein-tyrosine-phosphatase
VVCEHLVHILALMTEDQTPKVVFLCVHNAGRSQMAAAFARHLGGNRIDVFSGGSEPTPAVNPGAIEVMGEVGIDISDSSPQHWNDEIVAGADLVVTMGCGDECPFFPGVTYEDWPLSDPAGRPVEEVRAIREEIRRRVTRLLISLGIPCET